ncbi:hypothetical protein A7X12_10180 [Sphingomonas sp. TDK1]|nr:hypothetical protein A7X12_10180 [Sphingomonas sp. TDK1]
MVVLALTFVPGCAAAQNSDLSLAQQSSVSARTLPGVTPQGIPVGGFRLVPALGTMIGYDDNVYNRNAPILSEGHVRFSPSLALRSSWSRHSLRLTMDGEARRYFDLKTENSNQFSTNLVGRYDLARDVRLNVSGGFAHRIEERGSATDVFIGPRPTRYNQTSAGLGVALTPGRMLFRLDGSATKFSYLDSRAADGSVVDLGGRDFETASLTARGGYEVRPGIYLFASGSVNRARYPRPQAIDRASDGYTAGGGLQFDLGDVVGGEVTVTYLKQRFVSSLFRDVGGLGYSTKLYWNPTTLLSLELVAMRTLQRAPLQDVSALDQDIVRLTADYEVLRRMVITGAVEHLRTNFRGIGRSENRLVSSLSGRYNLTRFIDLTASVSFRNQSSAIATRNFDASEIRVGAVAKY